MSVLKEVFGFRDDSTPQAEGVAGDENRDLDPGVDGVEEPVMPLDEALGEFNPGSNG